MEKGHSIYHYSSIETLAMILASRRIRFNSLMNVDDLIEAKTLDPRGIRNFILISCWSNSSTENIALWKMYSKSGTGCKIKMSSSLFYPASSGKSKDFYTPKGGVEILYPIQNGYKIKYVSEFPMSRVLNDDEDDTIVNISKIARLKEKHWEFQNEVRFVIYQFLDLPKNSNSAIKHSVKQVSRDFYDLEVRQIEFEKMEIVLGPGANEGHKIICQSLIDKYNPKAKLRESNLKGKVKIYNS